METLNQKISSLESAVVLLEIQQATCPKANTSAVLRAKLASLKSQRFTCVHCGKPSDRAENVCSGCKYGVR